MADLSEVPVRTTAMMPHPAYLPLMLFTTWWNALLESWCPARPSPPGPEDCHDLPLPDPLEDTADHALFA